MNNPVCFICVTHHSFPHFCSLDLYRKVKAYPNFCNIAWKSWCGGGDNCGDLCRKFAKNPHLLSTYLLDNLNNSTIPCIVIDLKNQVLQFN